jgi:hypothetical protein
MALAGVLVFKDKTMGNILNNFPSDNGIVNLARFCFGFNCFTTLPLELFVYDPQPHPVVLIPFYLMFQVCLLSVAFIIYSSALCPPLL